MTQSRTVLRVLLGLGVGGLIWGVLFSLIASRWGEPGTPEFTVPTYGPGFGYSFSVQVEAPWWAWPVSVTAGACAGGVALLLTRPKG